LTRRHAGWRRCSLPAALHSSVCACVRPVSAKRFLGRRCSCCPLPCARARLRPPVSARRHLGRRCSCCPLTCARARLRPTMPARRLLGRRCSMPAAVRSCAVAPPMSARRLLGRRCSCCPLPCARARSRPLMSAASLWRYDLLSQCLPSCAGRASSAGCPPTSHYHCPVEATAIVMTQCPRSSVGGVVVALRPVVAMPAIVCWPGIVSWMPAYQPLPLSSRSRGTPGQLPEP
jgi:hypothetical protein